MSTPGEDSVSKPRTEALVRFVTLPFWTSAFQDTGSALEAPRLCGYIGNSSPSHVHEKVQDWMRLEEMKVVGPERGICPTAREEWTGPSRGKLRGQGFHDHTQCLDLSIYWPVLMWNLSLARTSGLLPLNSPNS